MTVTDSTVSGNTADYSGGGIYGDGLTLTNSTVSGNTADYSGGGIYGDGLTLTNSTVSGNDANQSGAGIYSGDATLTHTIVAGNGTTTPNCNEALDSLGYNLTDDDSCGFTAPGDLVVADAMLGPLADNGGPTETHALLAGSPAIDAGSPDCPPPSTDQRGVTRPQGAACDVGAFESGPAAILVEIDIKPGSDPNSVSIVSDPLDEKTALVFDEIHVMVGLQPVLLRQPDIITSSIVVTDQNGLPAQPVDATPCLKPITWRKCP
jgi:predicted outer membrane repeat protein